MSSRFERRTEALRALILAHGLDALLVTGSPNLRYLTGFTGSAGLVLATADRLVLITDFRYAAQAPAEVERWVDVRIERASLWKGVRQCLQTVGAARAGVNRVQTTLAELDEVRQAEQVEVVPVPGLVERLRASKDPGEVDAVREAARLASEALAGVLGFVAPGRTELEIAAELERAVRLRGSEWHPFPPIVASGPRSALPHARSTSREVRPGELLVIDFGSQVDGYCSDLTRTFVVGAEPDGRQQEVYDLVRRAQSRAVGGLRAGMTGAEADRLAREPIERAGFGEAFGHSLGHGLGLEVHEEPRLSRTNEGPLPTGAVVTVEPGVYLEGWGGVRIEDDVVIGPEGATLLSDGRTELVVL